MPAVKFNMVASLAYVRAILQRALVMPSTGLPMPSGCGIDQHEGDARVLVAAVGPGVVGAALDHDVARFSFTVESSMSISISPSMTMT